MTLRFATGGAAVLLAAGLVLCGCSNSPHRASPSTAHPSVDDSYGALPTFLPTLSNGVADTALTGSPGHPAVTSQGEPVVAEIGGGTVQVQVTGPDVPGEGLPKVTDATTCTWTIRFERAMKPVSIRLTDFITVDDMGHAYRLHLAPGTARPPSVLQPGRSTTFKLRAVMATGEGVMRWQPAGHALGVWDFVVEND